MLKDAVPLKEIARALVVMLRHHGDVLLATPVLGVLKAHAPDIEIDALVYDQTAPLLEGHPALAELHTVGSGRRSMALPARLLFEWRLHATLRARPHHLVLHPPQQPPPPPPPPPL